MCAGTKYADIPVPNKVALIELLVENCIATGTIHAAMKNNMDRHMEILAEIRAVDEEVKAEERAEREARKKAAREERERIAAEKAKVRLIHIFIYTLILVINRYYLPPTILYLTFCNIL